MSANQTKKDDGRSLEKKIEEARKQHKTVEENSGKEFEIAWDDVSGAQLDPKAARKARQEEFEYVRKMSLYDKVPIKECVRKIGRQPISKRWIDISKRDDENANYRSRLVARETNTHKRGDLLPQRHFWRR